MQWAPYLYHNCWMDEPFCEFNYVFVHYCSSDWWAGDSDAENNTAGMHFRGRNIVRAVFEELIATTELKSAEQIVFWGTSAGGVGALNNADRIGEYLY